MNKITILVIENQKSQFIHICNNIERYGEQKFHVLPIVEKKYPSRIGEYEKFMNNVRVALNTRNKDERINIAKGNIIKYINKHPIDIIIMDHNLVGWHEAEDGIDLAYYIVEEEDGKEKIDIPILFLSRTSLNTIKSELLPQYSIKGKFDTIKSVEKDWIEKGYAGGALLEENYFKKNVIEKINELVTKSRGVNPEILDSFLEPYKENTTKDYNNLVKNIQNIKDVWHKIPRNAKNEIISIREKKQKIQSLITELESIINIYK